MDYQGKGLIDVGRRDVMAEVSDVDEAMLDGGAHQLLGNVVLESGQVYEGNICCH